MSNVQPESSIVPDDAQSENNVFSTIVDAITGSSYSENNVSSVTETITDKAGDDSSAAKSTEDRDNASFVDNRSDNIGLSNRKDDPLQEVREQELSENYYSLPFPTPILAEDTRIRYIYHRVIENREFDYDSFLNFGLANFMSYAAHFCKYEAQNAGAEIISVGCGRGAIEREIVATYRKHFAEEIKITLVDPNPDYVVDFKTVDELINERPNVVRNCIVFIIWPEPMNSNDGYDINALRKLQPLAALTTYEPTEVSGSEEFTAFLYRESEDNINHLLDSEYRDQDRTFELDNYKVEETVKQKSYLRAGDKTKILNMEITMEPATRLYNMRMIRLKRTD